LGSIIVGISAVLEEDSWWKGFLCVLVGILICVLGVFFMAIVVKSILDS